MCVIGKLFRTRVEMKPAVAIYMHEDGSGTCGSREGPFHNSANFHPVRVTHNEL